ncbi:universal stress protein [Nocardia abscessus]|uniref:universal stress protein n=1 Tax=Nocardia abscessus TaxID=120957 RepID=UPI0024563278|nr:universal stress protein [Nocardia abscessus]
MNPRQPSRKPIVVGTDGSAQSVVAVRWAAQTAALHDAPLHISLVVESSLGAADDDPPRPAALLRVREADEAIERAAEAAVAAAHAVRDIAIGTEIRTAHIATALIERSRSAAMLVVGTRGIGRVQRVLLGSVSAVVAREADCPVAVVPAETPLWDPISTGPVIVGVDGSTAEQAAIEVAATEASLRGVELVAVHTWGEIEPLAAIGTDWAALRRTEEALLATSLAGWQEQVPRGDHPARGGPGPSGAAAARALPRRAAARGGQPRPRYFGPAAVRVGRRRVAAVGGSPHRDSTLSASALVSGPPPACA